MRLPEQLFTLNYAPGPLDTDMQAEIRDSETVHPPTREYFRTAKKEVGHIRQCYHGICIDVEEQGKLVRPEDSALKCVKILKKGRYESGSHIDYYDKDSKVSGLEQEEEEKTD